MKISRLLFVLLIVSVANVVFPSCDRLRRHYFHKETTLQDEEDEKSDADKVRDIVRRWNESLNRRDRKMSYSVYAPEVFFYTTTLPAGECVAKRIDMAEKDPSWHQEIISDIEVTDFGNGLMQANFIKESRSSKGTHQYPSYLELRKTDGKWRIVKESDKVTDRNVQTRNIPEDAVRGDFDGDGEIDHLWISAKYDSEGYAITKLTLESDNPALAGYSWNKGLMGVMLVNLGDLNHSHRDFLGAIPHAISTWCNYETLGFKDGYWKNVLPVFTVHLDLDDEKRVFPSTRRGFVTIKENIMGSDDPFTPSYTEMRLNW